MSLSAAQGDEDREFEAMFDVPSDATDGGTGNSELGFGGKDIETCEILDTTGVFLRNETELNLDGLVTVVFRLVPHFLYQNQIAM